MNASHSPPHHPVTSIFPPLAPELASVHHPSLPGVNASASSLSLKCVRSTSARNFFIAAFSSATWRGVPTRFDSSSKYTVPAMRPASTPSIFPATRSAKNRARHSRHSGFRSEVPSAICGLLSQIARASLASFDGAAHPTRTAPSPAGISGTASGSRVRTTAATLRPPYGPSCTSPQSDSVRLPFLSLTVGEASQRNPVGSCL